MTRSSFIFGAFFLMACGSNGGDDSSGWDSGNVPDGSLTDRSAGDSSTKDGSATDAPSSTDSTVGCGASCPTGYTCGTANGLPVCRSMTSTIPLFTNVYVIMMENTTLTTLEAGTIPNLKGWQSKYATGSDYHGVTHPSLPNYIALTSGDTQGIGCDCPAAHGNGGCIQVGDLCSPFPACSCDVGTSVKHLGDQLETAGKTWMDFGESMGTPCNVTDSGNYAQRHNPFLYYDDVQLDSTRCNAHVVDYSSFKVASPADFNFIAPNLCDDMHNTCSGNNITQGDTWLGTNVPPILSSTGYTSGGLLVIVWDEDDSSGGLTPPYTDDPIGIWVFSPYAKSGGYVSKVMANHYSLLATIEDGLGVGRLGKAATATPLSDYFPSM